MKYPLVPLVAAAALAGFGGWAEPALAQRIIREAFEDAEPHLRLGKTDGQIRLLDHRPDTDVVHGGEQAERLSVRITSGSFAYIELPIQPSLIIEELEAKLWVHGSRPGVKFGLRVVLPNQADPVTGQKPASVFLDSEILEGIERWRPLTLRRPDLLLTRKQHMLQALVPGQPVDTSGAYCDAVMLDLGAEPGDVTLVVDDLQVGPVVPPSSVPVTELAAVVPPNMPNIPADPGNPPLAPLPSTQPPLPMASDPAVAVVPLNQGLDPLKRPAIHQPDVADWRDQQRAEIVGDRLLVGGRPFMIRAVNHTDAPIDVLKQMMFNTLVVDWPPPPGLLAEAAAAGMYVVPRVPTIDGSVSALDFNPQHLFYLVGQSLPRELIPTVEATAEGIRALDPQRNRPLSSDVASGLRPYSRTFDMIGTRRFPLMTSLELPQYRQWLVDQKYVARPGTMFWTWIQTHPPEEVIEMVHGQPVGTPLTAPIGPQPEQIRLLAYAAVSAGYRGLLFSSDRAFSHQYQGRTRHLQTALLNMEMTLVESFLAEANPVPIKTSHPDIAGVLFRHELGTMVMLHWQRTGSQYCVGQAAANDVQVMVEAAPESAQVFQVSLGEVRGLKRTKDIGGVRITVPEFDTAALVVMTTRNSLYAKYQELVQQMAPQAAAWQLELTDIEVARTEEVHARLTNLGKGEADLRAVLADAREFLARGQQARNTGDARLAFMHAQRAMRLARFVQREYWDAAVKAVPSPVAEPYLTSFYSLPEHYTFLNQLGDLPFSENQVPAGDFEREGNLDAIGWTYQPRVDSELVPAAMLVGGAARVGQRALELSLRPRAGVPSPVIDNSRVEMASPAVQVQPGQVVKISGFVFVPQPLIGSRDGLLVWDSVGGESLALRFNKLGDGWQPFVIYRPVHQAGTLRVHLALTGIGHAFLDDLSVQVGQADRLPIALSDNSAVGR